MAGIPAVADDFRGLLRAFIDPEVRFLTVGGYALVVHGPPRATADLDVWIECTQVNAARAYEALRAFGAPLHDLAARDLETPGTVFQIGMPPLRIFFLVAFWVHDTQSRRRQLATLGGIYGFDATCPLVFAGILGWI